MKVSFVFLYLFVLSACAELRSPEIISFDGVSDFSLKERSVFVTVKAQVINPNNKTITIHKVDSEVEANNRNLGQLKTLQKIRFKKRDTLKIAIPLVIELEKGAMFQLGMLALRDSANFVFKGNVLGGWGIFKKSVPFEIEKKLPTKSLIRP